MEFLEPDLREDRPQPVAWETYVNWLTPQWESLLASDPSEPDVQGFLEQHPALLPGSIGDIGPGGHHGPHLSGVWRQPPLEGLAKNRRPDFMWITRSTSLITPICIEIEKPGKHWFTRDETPTAELTQAQSQLAEWKAWFGEPENESIFRKTYLDRDYDNRQLLPQYVLIYGRRREFDVSYGRHRQPDRLRKMRDLLRRENESFMTFDSLEPTWEAKNFATLTMTSGGPELTAVPPTFTTGPSTLYLAETVREPRAAVNRTPLWDEDRKAHVIERYLHWQAVADSGTRRNMRGGTGE